METTRVFLLLIGICSVTLRQAHALCCTASEDITFTMEHGNCASVGGKWYPRGCRITVCGDGYKKRGHCGEGPCSESGCDCVGGCRNGEFSKNFKHNFLNYGIEIIDALHSSF